MTENDILKLAYNAINNNEECKIKMPPSNEIHSFNMALNSLLKKEYVTVKRRDMVCVVLELTETGLEVVLDGEN